MIRLSSCSTFSVLLGFISFILVVTSAQAQQNVQNSFNPQLDMAVFSLEDIELTGSARIVGNAATNSIQPGSVRLNSWAHPNSIDGNFYIGPNGDQNSVINSVNPNSVGGSVMNLSSVRNYMMPEFPDFPSKDVTGSSVHLRGNASMTLKPADFAGKYIPSIRIQSNTILTIDLQNGNHVLYVGDLRVEQGHIRFTNAGSLIILVEDNIILGGSSTIHDNGSSNELFMFYKGSSEVNFAGNTRFSGSLYAQSANIKIGASNGILGHIITGGSKVLISGNAQAVSRVVYAPKADVRMSGSGSVRGAVVAKTFDGSGNSRVFYDGDLDVFVPDISEDDEPVGISVSGEVVNDINGITDNQIDGDSVYETDGLALYVHLLNAESVVLATQKVSSDGTFSFAEIEAGEVEIELSVKTATVGQAAPAKALTGRWVYVSERSGSNGTVQNGSGSVELMAGTDDISGVLFGIQQRPTAVGSELPASENPGSNGQLSIPESAFSGSDADGGSIKAIRIPQFPDGTQTLTINATDYTTETFPATGLIIPATASGNPQQPIELTPFDGNITIRIPFNTLDDAKSESEPLAMVKVDLTANSSPVSNTFPAAGFGTVAFEDSWPGKGDYDFNDVVVDYQFEVDSNTSNFIERIKATFVLRAFGAGYQNGFGFQLLGAIQNSDVTVSGYNLTENFITLDGNGTEAGQSHPTIIVFDNAFNEIEHPGVGIGVNTEPEAPFMEPVTYTIIINLTPDTYTISDVRMTDFNPFIFVNLDRGHEVHLPGYPPTDLADYSLFGQLDDASNPAQNQTYITSNNLPWAIQTYERFEYPIEKQDIIWVHLKFIEWAESGGTLFPDWYKDVNGYRNRALIYRE